MGTELFLNGISRQMGLASHTCRWLRVGTTEVKVRKCLVTVPTFRDLCPYLSEGKSWAGGIAGLYSTYLIYLACVRPQV